MRRQRTIHGRMAVVTAVLLALVASVLTFGPRPAAAGQVPGQAAAQAGARSAAPPAMALGTAHSCALTPAGSADCWGDSSLGKSADQPGPYTAIAAGDSHTCALRTSGAADCWGYDFGGSATDQPGPFTAITAGFVHTCALTPTGAADCWGGNDSGQAADRPGPYTAITAGLRHTCALTPTGAVECWGGNDSGQAANRPGPYTAISSSMTHNCALTPTGAAECWGGVAAVANQPGPFVALALGQDHACGLTPTGAVNCWGQDYSGSTVDQAGPYTAIAAGGAGRHTCAATPTGGIDCWGDNSDLQSVDQPGPYGRPVVIAGSNQSCQLIGTSGGLDCWGGGFLGGEVVEGAGPYRAVSLGFHSCALRVTGAADCWGFTNGSGADADQTGPYTAIAVSTNASHSCALRPNGSADCWGDPRSPDRPGPFTAITAGRVHTCGLTPAGAADCWGENPSGEAADQPGPYTAITAGFDHTCGLTPTGAADCWGGGPWGAATDRPGPFVAIDAGGYHTCGLTPAGAVECWGRDDLGQGQGRPGPYVAVDSGMLHNCAITPVGLVECWGNSGSGALGGVPTLGTTVGGTRGVAYDAYLPISPGQVNVTVALTDGSLPPGLSLAGPGHVTGTPTTAGTFPFTVTATNAFGTAVLPTSITIAPNVVTITPDHVSTTYGQAATFTYDVAGLTGGDPLLVAPTCGTVDPTPAVGVHTVACTGGDAGSNYTVDTSATATLTVGPAALTVTADDQARAYGAANPPLTYTLDGLVNGDTPEDVAAGISCTTAATAGSNVGPYSIDCTGTLANYTVSSVPGVLTVGQAGTVLELQPLVKGALAVSTTAKLTRADGVPVAGKAVSFSANGKPLCTGVTNASGVASCSVAGLVVKLGIISVVLLPNGLSVTVGTGATHTAGFAGDANLAPSYASRPL